MNSRSMLTLGFLAVALWAGGALAKGSMPEDLLKGRIIISDKSLPTSWNSVSSYVGQLKSLHKGTLWYDKKTNKVRIEYAAFFPKPINDVQVDLVIYDVTSGRPERKSSTEQFMNRGDRVIFNAITFEKEDFPMNRKYRLVIESRREVLASGEFLLRGQAENYSGTVNFSDDEATGKKPQ
jgi:hypothetical protein